MLNRILLLFLFLVLITKTAIAQHLLGGQIRTEYIYVSSPPRIQMSLELYRTADSSPQQNVSFSWGDGMIENLELIGTGLAAQNLAVDYYRGSHYYDTTGYMIYEYRDSFLVDDVLNIPNSGEHYLYLTDTVLVCDSVNTPILHPAINSYEGLIPLGGVENFLLLEDGSIIKPFSLSSFAVSPPAASISTLLPYPIEGSTLPEATDSLRFLYNYLFIWDRPIASGKYGFRFHNRQMSNINNPIYHNVQTEEGYVLTNTLTRLIILEVTEDMIVNALSYLFEHELNIYPNPTSTTTILEYGGLSGESHLKAINAQGQVILQKTLNGTAQLQREVIDVSTWPTGVYWVELRNEAGQATKKLVVE